MSTISGTDIAIIGMAGRFPGAANVDVLWENLCNEVESICFLTPEQLECSGIDRKRLEDPSFIKASSFLQDVERFDAGFFNISPREADLMDPQHRVFLECAWEALEQAGYANELNESRVGVFGGATMSTYLLCNLMQAPETAVADLVQLNVGNSNDFLTTRVSYKLNLKGPSHAVQSACSTSLVAVHRACQSILQGECDMALAGGVSINLKLRYGYQYVEGGMTSPDGHCRAFDEKAQGTIFGSGAGIVVLKALDAAVRDRDYIYAVIKGSAVNNDGSVKVGYTAPGVSGQASVISEALGNAGVEPESISYVETHGTGTALGDPIEIQALGRAYRTDRVRRNTCGIGSVKTNLGHLDAAAGITGLIKAALALKHKRIPATLHYKVLNPQVDLQNTPFYVVSKLQDWRSPHGPRRAGVSAFGVGGTNAHVILEEAPKKAAGSESRPWQLLTLSARSEVALQRSTDNLVRSLSRASEPDLADIAFTLQTSRRCFPFRRAVFCSSVQEASEALERLDPQRVHTAHEARENRPIAFLFPGQGSQYIGMGKDLYEQEPEFRATVEHCSCLLKPDLGLELKDVLYPSDQYRDSATELLNQTWITQPALFVVEYAIAQLLMSWGLLPASMFGHSIGEYVAASLAEVFSLEEALALVSVRGRLMQSLPPGAMLAAGLSEIEAQGLVGPHISLAAVNGPMQCVFAGEEKPIEQLKLHLQRDGVTCHRLQSTRAFHSHMTEAILPEFAKEIGRIGLRVPRVRYLSNVTGEWIKPEDAISPEYWVRHLRQPVRASQGITILLQDPNQLVLEVGPGRTLIQMVRRQIIGNPERTLFATIPQPESGHLASIFGELWLAGALIKWPLFYSQERRRRAILPTYPFERSRYWIEPTNASIAMNPLSSSVDSSREPSNKDPDPIFHSLGTKPTSHPTKQFHPRPPLKNMYIAPATDLEKRISTICTEVLGIAEIGVDDNFFELGGDSLMALQVVSGLKKDLALDVPVVTLYEKLTIRSLAAMQQTGNGQISSSGEHVNLEEHKQDRVMRSKDYQQKQRSKRVGV